MHKSVLMNADIHERSEIRDVCNDSWAGHAGFQIFQVVDVFTVLKGHELVAWIAPGFFKFPDDVLEREVTQLFFEIRIALQCLNSCAHQIADGLVVFFRVLLEERIIAPDERPCYPADLRLPESEESPPPVHRPSG